MALQPKKLKASMKRKIYKRDDKMLHYEHSLVLYYIRLTNKMYLLTIIENLPRVHITKISHERYNQCCLAK